jgi:hypothetical protein
MSLPKFVPAYILFIEEETRALQQAREPKIIPPKQIIQEPIVIVKEAEPELLIQPVELIQEPEVIKEPKELIELRRLWDAGELGMTEEMYNLHAQALMTWWVETGSSQQEN